MEQLEQLVTGYNGSHIAIRTNLVRRALDMPEEPELVASTQEVLDDGTISEGPGLDGAHLAALEAQSPQELAHDDPGYYQEEAPKWLPTKEELEAFGDGD